MAGFGRHRHSLKVPARRGTGYHLAVQLQAAQNLCHGHGLATFSFDGEPDLATPTRLIPLTYFPLGYSLCAAALIAIGSNAAATVKILAAAGTILGWWGWALLAHSFMGGMLERGRPWRWSAVAIALVTPLFFTPRWTGTDLFLWAAVPWFLMAINRGADETVANRRRFDLLAGAVCGFAVLMRYQALFLVGYAGLLILLQSRMKMNETIRRGSFYAIGLAPFLAGQMLVNYLAAGTDVTPGGFYFDGGPAGRLRPLWQQFLAFPVANQSLIWWFPGRLIDFLTRSGADAPWLLALTLAVLAIVPIVAAKKWSHRNLFAATHDIRIAATGLFLALPLFLWACALGGRFYVSVPRYSSH